MTRFEILIELNNFRYNLDLFQEESIEINYNIADINDISSRNSSYTKTVRIPETSLNRQIFGDIADLSVSSTFNPNLKTKCWVLVDTVVVLEGYLQLRNVQDDIDLGGRVYEIVIFAENDNFVKELQEFELTDLDFSELSHTYSSTNILTSWTQSWNWGYYYPLIDYGYDWDYADINGIRLSRNDVEIDDMYPATNVKYIVDKIFSFADYNYQSDFLNSDIFKDLYIPFNRTYLARDTSGLEDKFAIGMTGPASFTSSRATIEAINETFSRNLGGGASALQFLVGKYRIPFNNENQPYGDPDGLYDITTYEYTANTNDTSQLFVCNFDISFFFRNTINYGISDYDFIDPLTGQYTNHICFKRSKDPLTGVDIPGGVVMPVNGSTNPVPFKSDIIDGLEIFGPAFVFGTNVGATPSRVVGKIATDMLDNTTSSRTKLYPGEKVWVEVQYTIPSQIKNNFIGNPNVSYTFITFNDRNEFFNTLNDRILPNEFIDYNLTVVPKNIKQIDFFTSLIKMFNLYVEPSKDDERTLLIEPREQFYETGEIKDWTYKLDINTPLDIQILGETQNKKTIFTYKEDKDYYNVDYKDFRAGRVYGQYEYDIENDFVTGEKTVELIFSPTPIVQVPNSNNLVIPKIGKLNNNLFSPTDHNIRILTKFRGSTTTPFNFTNVTQYSSSDVWNTFTLITGTHGLSEGDCISLPFSNVNDTKPIFKVVKVVNSTSFVINLLFTDFSGSTTGIGNPLEGLLPTDNGLELWAFNLDRYRAYPYLGHFNNPFKPNYDLNYGQTVGLYYPETSVTNDNLFSVYWQNQMTEISDKDSRIISGDFYLTPDDIASFRFNQKIFIINQYYKVNKISYDPVERGLSKVELIKSLVITIPREFSQTNPSIPNSATFSNDSVSPIKDPRTTGGLINGPNNTVRKNRNLIVGTDNQSYGQNVMLMGSGNIVSSNDNYVFGDDNKVSTGSEGNMILGNQNSLVSGVNDSFVFGDNVAAELSNSFYVLGRFVNLANYVNGSRNEVQNPFSDVQIDYTNASRDLVRELGGDSIINYINGGRIVILG
jgi:hypothetical protein